MFALAILSSYAHSQNSENGAETEVDAPIPAPEAIAPQATPPPLSVPDTESQKLELLNKSYQDKGLVNLTAKGKSFPGLWHSDLSGTPLGAVLIFHDAGQTAGWPSTVAVLHEHLTRHGWATLSFELPDPRAPAPPQRPEPTAEKASAEEESSPDAPAEEEPSTPTPAQPEAAAETTVSNEQAVDIEQEVQARAKAALDFLNEKGQFNIAFIGYGLGASRAARFLDGLENLKTGKLDQQLRQTKAKAVIARSVRALVLIDARNQIPHSSNTSDKNIVDWLNDEHLPILDIHSGSHFLDAIESRDRLKAARKKQLKRYTQIQLTPPASTSDQVEDLLAKRIRGFLVKHAKGMRLDGRN